jgi:hypothetical protein
MGGWLSEAIIEFDGTRGGPLAVHAIEENLNALIYQEHSDGYEIFSKE